MATTKKTTNATQKQNTKTEIEPKQEAIELQYVLMSPFFTPIIVAKEHYEELKRLNKIVESKIENTIYFRLDV